MSLFFDVLSSINNPNQQGSVAQLESLTNSLQGVAAERGINPTQLQGILSTLGGALGPALQKQQGTIGAGQLESMLGQLTGNGSLAGLQSMFPPAAQQQLAQVLSQKTGVSSNMIQGLLPTLLPAVMGLLNMGSSTPGTKGGVNPLLNAFLSGKGDTDLGTVFQFANRFLNPPTR